MDEYPLRAKKRSDFVVWKQAVQIASTIRPGRADNTAARAALEALKADLKEVRNAGL